jgi:hypothetical protein
MKLYEPPPIREIIDSYNIVNISIVCAVDENDVLDSWEPDHLVSLSDLPKIGSIIHNVDLKGTFLEYTRLREYWIKNDIDKGILMIRGYVDPISRYSSCP